jgi:hypothetical protein
VPKDPRILPSLADVAPYPLPRGLVVEQTAIARQLREALASLPGADNLQRLQEESRRLKREDEWRAQRRKQENYLRAQITHAQRQIEAWRKVEEKAEAKLAALVVPPKTERETADLPSQWARSLPTDSSPSISPAKETKRNVAAQALSHLYPQGAPAGTLLKKIVADVNDWIDADARANRHEPRHASADTVSRALGRRK